MILDTVPAIGTHDEQLLDDILGYLNRFNISKDDFSLRCYMEYGVIYVFP